MQVLDGLEAVDGERKAGEAQTSPFRSEASKKTYYTAQLEELCERVESIERAMTSQARKKRRRNPTDEPGGWDGDELKPATTEKRPPHHTLVTVKLPTAALDDLQTNGMDSTRVKDIIQALATAPITVLSRSTTYFTITVSVTVYDNGSKWTRPFFVSSNHTLYELAKAVEDACGLPAEAQGFTIPLQAWRRAGMPGESGRYFEVGCLEDAVRSLQSVSLACYCWG